MRAEDLVASYVLDVVRLLPRSQRADVAAELSALLREDLAARLEGADATTEETVAREFLVGFGRPAEVAARYRPPVSVIDPADTRSFLITAVAGVLVLALVASLARDVRSLNVLMLSWLGLLVLGYGMAAWARRRWPRLGEWKPRRLDRDRVNRAGVVAAIIAAGCGVFLLVRFDLALDFFFGGRAAPAAYEAVLLDDEFLRLRLPVLLGLYALDLALYVWLIVRGEWNPVARRVDIGLTIAMSAVLIGIAADGAVFQAHPSDQFAKLAMVVLAVVGAFDAVRKSRRLWRRNLTTSGLPRTAR